ncbi:MAG TPA: VanZ family protein [Thermoanaerobaculia bacterium]|nr:VanZ family protein [Thermoanaerobaculia bacterium]
MSAAPRVKRARIAAALWGGFLFAVTSWPNPPAISAGGLPVDKITHFFLYAVEAFLLDRAFPRKGSGLALTRMLAITGGMALWGMVDEAHQQWIPGRQMDSGDLLADVSGALGGAIAAGVRSRGSVKP